ncbi:MAG: DNA/RNA nuclease SfsA [Leptospirales bacterium]|nr:DNA/RNA nuclease SfsA [Leptospirales bacterium]
MIKYPEYLVKAILIKRINRFVAEVFLNGRKTSVYVPNTGRLSELALPGTEVLLSEINTKFKYKILYIIDDSFPVMIDSSYSNKLMYSLLKERKVPELEFEVIKKEPAYENHRFDFHVGVDDKDFYIEVKSCTLFYKSVGSFPDAISSRATEHIKALADSGKGKLVFFVLKSTIEKFIPNYHTDFKFYETLNFYKDKVDVRAYSVQYNEDLEIESLKNIPVLFPKVEPKGIFLLLLSYPPEKKAAFNNKSKNKFFIYCGSSNEDLFKKIASIKRKDGLRKILPARFNELKIISDIPIVSSLSLSGRIKDELIKYGGVEIDKIGVGIDNINEDSFLIQYNDNPAEKKWFWDMVFGFRWAINH